MKIKSKITVKGEKIMKVDLRRDAKLSELGKF